MTFGTNLTARALRDDHGDLLVERAPCALEAKTRRLQERVRQRDTYFRRSIMADSTMGVMLSLFLAELKAETLSETSLRLSNLLQGGEGRRVIDTLIHAGLAAVTGHGPEQRSVGLTPLGSARMRSFISDYPDI